MWFTCDAPRRRRLLGLGLAGSLSLAVLAGCGDDPEPTAADPSSSPSTAEDDAPSDDPSDGASGSGEPSAAPSESEEPTSTTTVPVYVVGDTPQGQRLFREFRSVEASDPLVAAGELLAGGSTLDPDYDSLVPNGSFADVRRGDDGAFEVVLDDESWTERPDGMSAQQARLAVQQVVYTLQGVAQERQPLRVYAEDGSDPVDLFGVPTAGGVAAAPQLKVLGLVNVTMPEEATVVGDTFTATGVASSFEGNVPWEVRRGGDVVLDGFATASGYLDRLYPWSAEVDVSSLDPGTYSFVATTSDPSGGEGGGPTEDTKTIRVE